MSHGLLLQAMTHRDLDDLSAVITDPFIRASIEGRLKDDGFNLSARCERDGALVACGGIRRQWTGVGDAWFLGSPLLVRYRFSLWRQIRALFPMLMRELELWRVEGLAYADHPSAQRFMQHLGWYYEGRKLQYAPDRRDVDVYVMLRHECKELQP
jgi:hypothetical protein